MSNLDPDIWLENPFDGSGADSEDCIDCIECVGGGAAEIGRASCRERV